MVQRATTSPNICVSGGLFYNSYFNRLVQSCGLFDATFVPVDPGNPGLVATAVPESAKSKPGAKIVPISPFLGTESALSDIKATLDNCKLTYSLLHEDRLIEQTVDALVRGHLVGWFHGRMEWGPRALGNRSILASPLSQYATENLNVFLKHREPYRSYGVSVCDEDASSYFEGTVSSPFMECEYLVRDPGQFPGLGPEVRAPVRVHTVGDHPRLFRKLLKAFGLATGTAVLINTSFNGFREPIVSSPRDAVRVFYGTGLDMVALGTFVLRK